MPSRFAKTFHGCWCVCKCLLFQLFCLKGYLLCMLQFCYFSFKQKRQIMQFELQERRILIIFHGIFGVSMRFVISQFFFFFFFWKFRIIFMLYGVERLFMTPKTIFKCLLISSDVTVTVGLINYPFHLTIIWQKTSIFTMAVQLLNLVSIGLLFKTL